MSQDQSGAADAAPTQRVSALQSYQQRLETASAELAELKARDGVFAKVRLALFLFSLVMFGTAAFSSAGALAWSLAAGLFVAFFVTAVLNEPLRQRMEQCDRRVAVCDRLVARCQRDWEALDWKSTRKLLTGLELTEHQKDVADDLDLIGRSSLFQLVSMAGTSVGARELAIWLSGPATSTLAKQRSQAIRCLGKLRDKRLEFYSQAQAVGGGSGGPEELVRWSHEEDWLPKRTWLMHWANASAMLAVACVVVAVGWQAFGLSAAAAQGAVVVLMGLLGVNFLITTMMLSPAHQIFAVVMASRDSVFQYEELFQAAAWLDDDPDTKKNPLLKELTEQLVHDPKHSAVAGMRSLGRVAWLGSLRNSAATFLLYLPLQAFGLWDVRVLKRLEAWKATQREFIAQWFTAFGKLEALMSLAALRDENPDWCFPTWTDGKQDAEVKFTSQRLGHPLLTDESRVCNDVQVGPTGTILLVTGSNMSGKSTMLRSVGLNVALAGTGAPVCANELCLPSTELSTSIRVRDNLAEGVSFYMAELHRLKGVVDQARALDNRNDLTSLFLLDEILQGTNSRERMIAVAQVLRHLVGCQAIGAISTHDLELADDPELASMSHIVHFRETIVPGSEGAADEMTFDYQMRQGVSPTTNALKLLEIVGLGE